MAYCRIRWCEEEIGDDRKYCADHIPRDFTDAERKMVSIRFPWHVFETIDDNTPIRLIGIWRTSTEAYKQADTEKKKAEEAETGVIVWAIHDGNSMSDPHMKLAIQAAFDNGSIDGMGGGDYNQMAEKKSNKTGSKAGGPSLCLCGCGDMTGGGRFLPGHDAKLKGSLIRAVREARKDGNGKAEQTAVSRLEELGWAKFVPDAEADAARAAKKREKVAKLADAKKGKKVGKKAKAKAGV